MVPKKAFLHFHVMIRNKQYNFLKGYIGSYIETLFKKKRLFNFIVNRQRVGKKKYENDKYKIFKIDDKNTSNKIGKTEQQQNH